MSDVPNSIFIPGILTYTTIGVTLIMTIIFPPRSKKSLSVRKTFQFMLSLFVICKYIYI